MDVNLCDSRGIKNEHVLNKMSYFFVSHPVTHEVV